jgi:tRNA(Arg) A34 adenosine deaminase TadA
MRAALKLATEGALQDGCGPFGAVVAKDGQIIGSGHNRVALERDPSAHAEIVAIREACQQLQSHVLEGCELYTSCEPCPMCLGAAYWARLERVYYAASQTDAAAAGFDDAFLYAEMAKPQGERRLPMINLTTEALLEPFRIWAENPDKIFY